MNDVIDNFLVSMQTIADSAVKKLQYDKTIICKIVDDSKSDKNEYIVSDGSTRFIAYTTSSEIKLKNGTSVYVTIPQGDYNNQKWILGKKTGGNAEQVNYVPPFDKYFNITGNILEDIDWAATGASLLANCPAREGELTVNNIVYKPFGDVIDFSSHTGYTRLGLEADFMSFIPTATSGNYGLELWILTKSETADDSLVKQQDPYRIRLDSNDMWGNPYNFENYFTQQAIFDISEMPDLYQAKLFFYQENNFKTDNEDQLDYLFENNEKLPDNLFVNNIKISFGYEVFDKENALLYTKDSLTYSGTNTDNKIIKLRWNHLLDKECVAITNKASLDRYITNRKVNIYWFKYNKNSNDSLGGTYWERVSEGIDFSYTLVPSLLNEAEYVKAIIELVDTDGLNSYNNSYQNKLDELNSIIRGYQAELVKVNEDLKYYERLNILNSNTTGAYDKDIEELLEKRTKLYQDVDDTQKSIDRLKLDTSAYYTYIKTNTLAFTNKETVVKPEEEDMLRALTLTCQNNGVFKIYDSLTNDLITNSEQYNDKVLKMRFESILTSGNDAGISEIRWYIPKNNTMIQPPMNGVNYVLSQDEYVKEDDNYYIIIRVRPKLIYLESDTYSTKACEATQTFRIKPHLLQSATENTVKCVVVREKEYEKSLDLDFGNSGTVGTNNTLIISLDKEINGDDNPPAWTIGETTGLQFSAKLYDANDNDVTKLIKSLKWRLLYKDEVPFVISDAGILTQKIQRNIYSGCIVECLASINEVIDEANDGTATIYTAYFPVPVRKSKDVKNFIGADRIIYDAGAANPVYYRDKYQVSVAGDIYDEPQLYYGYDGNVSPVSSLANPDKEYQPYIKNGILAPRTMYMERVNYNLHVRLGDFWSQPLLIICNAYGSPVLNKWDGSFTMDTEEGTILSTMLGAGRKDANNRFEGVLMGDVRKGTHSDDTKEVGLYGYKDGVQSFGFKVDGTAFIGKSSGARLNFDGNVGTIQNAGYEFGRGMIIDFDGQATGRQGCYIDMLNIVPQYDTATITKDNVGTYYYDPNVSYYKDAQLKEIASVPITENNFEVAKKHGLFAYSYLKNGDLPYNRDFVYYTKNDDEYIKVDVSCQEQDYNKDLYHLEKDIIKEYRSDLKYYSDPDCMIEAEGPMTVLGFNAQSSPDNPFYYKSVEIAEDYNYGETYYEADGETEATGRITQSNIGIYCANNDNPYIISGVLAVDGYKPDTIYFTDENCMEILDGIEATRIVKAQNYIVGQTYYSDSRGYNVATGRITHESYRVNTYYCKVEKTQFVLTQCTAKDAYSTTRQYYDEEGNEVTITRANYIANPTKYYYYKETKITELELQGNLSNDEIDRKTFYNSDGTEAKGPITYTNFKDKTLYTDETYLQPLNKDNFPYGKCYTWGTLQTDQYVEGKTYYVSNPPIPVFTQSGENDKFVLNETYYNINHEVVKIDENEYYANKENYYYYLFNAPEVAKSIITIENFDDTTRYKHFEWLVATSYTNNLYKKVGNDYIKATNAIDEYNFNQVDNLYSIYGHKDNVDNFTDGTLYYHDELCLNEARSNYKYSDRQNYYYLINRVVDSSDVYNKDITYYTDSTRSEVAKLRIIDSETFNVILNTLGKVYAQCVKKVNNTDKYDAKYIYYNDIYGIEIPRDAQGKTITITESNYQNYYYTTACEAKSQVTISTTGTYFKIKDRTGYDLINIDKDKSLFAGWKIEQDRMITYNTYKESDFRSKPSMIFYAQDQYAKNSDGEYDVNVGVTTPLRWPNDLSWYNSGDKNVNYGMSIAPYSSGTNNWRIQIAGISGITWDGRLWAPRIFTRWLDVDGDWDNITNEDEHLTDMVYRLIEEKKNIFLAEFKKNVYTDSASYKSGYSKGKTDGYNSRNDEVSSLKSTIYKLQKEVLEARPGPSGCLDIGTLILLENNILKPIEELTTNDKVISYDIKNQCFIIDTIEEAIVHEDVKEILDIYLSDGTVIGITGNHPILTNEGWVAEDKVSAYKHSGVWTKELQTEQVVLGYKQNASITKIEKRKCEKNYKVYNIRTTHEHNFIANGYIVHNMQVKGT